jgi:hypothetical protein
MSLLVPFCSPAVVICQSPRVGSTKLLLKIPFLKKLFP